MGGNGRTSRDEEQRHENEHRVNENSRIIIDIMTVVIMIRNFLSRQNRQNFI